MKYMHNYMKWHLQTGNINDASHPVDRVICYFGVSIYHFQFYTSQKGSAEILPERTLHQIAFKCSIYCAINTFKYIHTYKIRK